MGASYDYEIRYLRLKTEGVLAGMEVRESFKVPASTLAGWLSRLQADPNVSDVEAVTFSA